MLLSSNRLRIIFAVLLVIAATFLWVKEPKSGKLSSRAEAVSETKSAPSQSPEREIRTSKNRAAPSEEIVDSEESWDIDLGGSPSSIRLALDEASLRDADGKETITRLVPPATQETLPARLAQLRSPGGVLPVAYLVGEGRSISSRRIITPDLRVQLDTSKIERIAAQNRLIIKDRPSYAPGWVILSAADAFAALDAMVNLRAEREVATADVLLATQQSLRALPNDPLVSNQWHLKNGTPATPRTNVNIEAIWNYPATTGSRGAGVRIGIVDDGMQTNHPDLSANADTTNDKDWNGGDSDPSPGTGDDHGTACAGNAAARGNNNLGVSGTAPLATLVGMRLIAAATTDAQEAEAITYLPDLVQIKSNSWGPDDTGSNLEGPAPLTLAALQTAATTGRGGKGSIIVWAGGNGGEVADNSNYDGYANSIYTFAIGATDSAGNRASYSEPGSNLVVCAPSSGGLGITTVDRTGSLGYNTDASASGGDYTDDFGGTSSATPTAAGIIALILEKNPNLGWRDIKEILIKSAFKFKPTDPGWASNGAGIPFNHQFGAGLIDATAAVNLAATWTNLPAQSSIVSTQNALSATIPNNSATGVTRTFDLSATNLRVEHATLKLSATHSARGNLEITLISPSGMASKLAEVHGDLGDNYSNWTFSSVRTWGELSTGTWTLKVADLSSTENSAGGILTAAELTLFGTPNAPVNPAPSVRITQPTADQVFSPGTLVTVNLSATDLTVGNTPGIVTQVELFDNNVSRGTDSTAPYSFSYLPAPGAHTLTAKATDSEGAVGNATSINFLVANQTPIITAVALSATGQSFTDTPLTVTSVTASDPENSALSYTYVWQSSIDQTSFTNIPGATSATAPSLAGNLLRCVVTASDGITSSLGFTTATVNLLARPATSAAAGASYSYTSGLVLRGASSPLSRQAIISEFSQGPANSNAEWIEILTLQSGSLAYWDLSDTANILIFLDDPIWDNIPAGTLIVIYNGAERDPLLPADDLDPSDGRMIVSSTNPAYFDPSADSWIPLGNSGDSIFLNNPNGIAVHSLSYGNSVAASPNIGSVGSGKSAYFAGNTDAKANLAANWRVTNSTTARDFRATRAAGDLFFSEYIEGTGDNKALEIYNPSSIAVNLATSSYKLEVRFNGAFNPDYTTTLTGTIAPGATFVVKNPNATAITGQQSNLSMTFDGNDSIILKKGTITVDRIGQIGVNPGVAWTAGGVTTVDKTLRRKAIISKGDINASNVFDPSAEWNAFPVNTLTGIGSHTTGAGEELFVTVTPGTFAENAGTSAATAAVSIAAALATNLVVNLASSNTGEFTVPGTVMIAAGQTSSSSFAIAAVDDLDSDGSQSATLTASAAGYVNAATVLTITDNEPSVEGVTPAAGNTGLNSDFVTAIRNGTLNIPALFRLGIGSAIPAGLSLNPNTGTLSGTISINNPAGAYPIVIERYNSLSETTAQSYSLTVTQGGGNTYSSWVGGFLSLGSATQLGDDFDRDGLPNGIENFLGTAPNISNAGLTQVSGTATTLIFRHSKSNTPASDLTPSYEWSSNLVNWSASGVTAGGITVTIGTSIITDTVAPANDLIQVTAAISGSSSSKIFVRLKTVK